MRACPTWLQKAQHSSKSIFSQMFYYSTCLLFFVSDYGTLSCWSCVETAKIMAKDLESMANEDWSKALVLWSRRRLLGTRELSSRIWRDFVRRWSRFTLPGPWGQNEQQQREIANRRIQPWCQINPLQKKSCPRVAWGAVASLSLEVFKQSLDGHLQGRL